MGTNGQLGTGDEEDADLPTLINSKHLKDVKVVRVAGGGQHTIILANPLTSVKENNNISNQKDEKEKETQDSSVDIKENGIGDSHTTENTTN